MNKKIVIQGIEGCFHQEAALTYFGDKALEFVCADDFEALASTVAAKPMTHTGIMAIENSIAGTILQNYRILREYQLRIVGEIYLKIQHNLMCLPKKSIEEMTEVWSHPMALNQCLPFLRKYPHLKMVETKDTALCAKEISEGKLAHVACIASKTAAELYQLDILSSGIESEKHNYTRFFIVQDNTIPVPAGNFNKASIYIKLLDKPGSLYEVLRIIKDREINLSKLQSYPIPGMVGSYYFHLDLEFGRDKNYANCIQDLQRATDLLEVLGVYKKASVEYAI